MQFTGVFRCESLIMLNYRQYDRENQSLNYQNISPSIAEGQAALEFSNEIFSYWEKDRSKPLILLDI